MRTGPPAAALIGPDKNLCGASFQIKLTGLVSIQILSKLLAHIQAQLCFAHGLSLYSVAPGAGVVSWDGLSVPMTLPLRFSICGPELMFQSSNFPH